MELRRNQKHMRWPFYILCWLMLAPAAWGRILLRWTQTDVPPAKALGVTHLVVPWKPDSTSILESARRQGFQLYVQASPDQVPQINAAGQKPITAIVVDIAPAQVAQSSDILEKLRAQYPALKFLLLDPNGKQPEMKGTMVVKRDGVLEITSPTAQPWIDSNVPLVRFEQGFRPEQVPLYTFAWDSSNDLQQQQGPASEDYSLAIAEANALHANLILALPEELERGLVANNTAAWALWKKLIPYLETPSKSENLQPSANIGVVTTDYDSAYEPMNLMARHNIPFRVLPLAKLSASNVAGLSMLLLFATPNAQLATVTSDFASAGGTVVTVALPGPFPWQRAPATRIAEHTTSYAVGKGRVIDLSEPIADPETFAQDVRRLMDQDHVLLSLWNALTTIGIPYRDSRTGATVLELVNYSGEPLRVQARVKGSFHAIRLETPERGCCQLIQPAIRDGFTEFVVPQLQVAARARLEKTPQTH